MTVYPGGIIRYAMPFDDELNEWDRVEMEQERDEHRNEFRQDEPIYEQLLIYGQP